MADQDPRAEELNKLKLALAIFSMHLDAFEARVEGDLIARKGLNPRSSLTSVSQSEASQRWVSRNDEIALLSAHPATFTPNLR
jgi:hypothetical protein